jgi:tRNA A-37 threonylcarbamoyl transferase component Bud32
MPSIEGTSDARQSQATSDVAPPGFRDVKLCGTGATSRVFRAEEIATSRIVALKRLHRHLVRDDKALARLKREFDALRRLHHEMLVPVSDVITWHGDPTLVMTFVDGEDLKERIVRDGRLSFEEAERIARALFDVLALTHGSGIVHRDIKPQNIRFDQDNRIFLLDFGSARLDASSQLTATGSSVGTPDYMAPELFAGSVYDPRVDIYGVGATLYECLTGHPPQSADSLAELANLRATTDVTPVADVVTDVPMPLARVVDRSLARQPEDRFPSAALAAWCLDHADAERAFAARRSRNPICLRCGSAIAAWRDACPVCRSVAPFAYPPGPSHVVIRSVESPAKFLEHVAMQFPERATPDHLLALAERVAALSYEGQRYVSFISDEAAAAVVLQLESAGARAVVIREPSWKTNALLTALTFPFYPILHPILSIHSAKASILSTYKGARSVLPAARSFAAVAFTVALFAFTFFTNLWRWIFAPVWNDVPALFEHLLTGLRNGGVFAAIVVLLGGFAFRFRNPDVPLHAKLPLPPTAVNETLFARSPRSIAKSERAASLWILPAMILLVLVEILGIAAIDGDALGDALRSDVPVYGHVGNSPTIVELPRNNVEPTNNASTPLKPGTAMTGATSTSASPSQERSPWSVKEREALARHNEAKRDDGNEQAHALWPARRDAQARAYADFQRRYQAYKQYYAGKNSQTDAAWEASAKRWDANVAEYAGYARGWERWEAKQHDRDAEKTRQSAYWKSWDARASSIEGYGALASLALGGLLFFAMAYRRNRIRRDAAALFAQLDLPAFAAHAHRASPDRMARGSAGAFARVPTTTDAFTVEAMRRAADVIPLLPIEVGNNLTRSLEALAMRRGATGELSPMASFPQVRVEESLLARCVVEADPEQKLRFELLALEGHAEAAAAAKWLQELEDAGLAESEYAREEKRARR